MTTWILIYSMFNQFVETEVHGNLVTVQKTEQIYGSLQECHVDLVKFVREDPFQLSFDVEIFEEHSFADSLHQSSRTMTLAHQYRCLPLVTGN